MLNGKKVLAIIPARKGSKRLPNKNIIDLCGKPLIAYTIEAALGSSYIDHVLVTTDCELIASIAKKSGADVPFLRPDNLATDKSTSMDVVFHALNISESIYGVIDYIVLLQPTSPLRTYEDIDNALKKLDTVSLGSVVSVCKTAHSPLWTNTLPYDLSMKNFLKHEYQEKRSQDLPTFYSLNGAIYVSTKVSLDKYKSFLNSETYASVMDSDNSIDIDNLRDFQLAEIILNETNK